MTEATEKPYTIAEFARLWQKSESTVKRRIDDGLLPFFAYDGRERRIHREAAHRIIRNGTHTTEQTA